MLARNGVRAVDARVYVYTIPTTKRWRLHALFLLGCISWIHVNLIGELYAVQVVFTLVALESLFVRESCYLWGKYLSTAVALFLISMLATLVTDLIVHPTWAEMARSIASMAFSIFSFIGLSKLLNHNAKRALYFGTGMALGMALGILIQPNPYSLAAPWKFGYGGPVLLLVGSICAGPLRKNAGACVALLSAYGVMSIILGSRSLGGIAILAAAMYLWISANRVRGTKQRDTPGKRVLIAAVMIISMMGILQAYSYLALGGYLGSEGLQKYTDQEGSRAGILVAGRPEIIYGLLAAKSSPIIGLGSGARRTFALDNEASRVYESLGIKFDLGLHRFDDKVPAHSHVVGAWVAGGAAAMFVWLWLLKYFMELLLSTDQDYGTLGPLPLLVAVIEVWNILFSPYGGTELTLLPFAFICCAIVRRDTWPIEIPMSLGEEKHVEILNRNNKLQPRSVFAASNGLRPQSEC